MQAMVNPGRQLYFVSLAVLLGAVFLFGASFMLIRHYGQPFSTGSIFFLWVGSGLILVFLFGIFAVFTRKKWTVGAWWNAIGSFVFILMSVVVFALQWFMLANRF